ncbi:hypothetical protein RRG08_016862 [Elysia crispata]|uniref:Uncharacterized protein n=1 Tax=Elysia crispata TaxID=231223 RepID=A0AAE0XMR6_9GAST|nr:hypothetical protein RRG08_016862 [Elysia crispata]
MRWWTIEAQLKENRKDHDTRDASNQSDGEKYGQSINNPSWCPVIKALSETLHGEVTLTGRWQELEYRHRSSGPIIILQTATSPRAQLDQLMMI